MSWRFFLCLEIKVDVLDAFKDFEWYAENRTDERIKQARTGNGKKYINCEMLICLRQVCIRHETTVSDNPEQNGLTMDAYERYS